MDKRYESPDIAKIWGNENKLLLWQNTEIAVIRARVDLGHIGSEVLKIATILEMHPIDIEWWKARDKEIRHDLNAFLDERLRHLPLELQPYFHDKMTSYDTEEPAFASMLTSSCCAVFYLLVTLKGVLANLARKYRYTIMMARTHGQEAELQTFGKRCLTWLRAIWMCQETLEKAHKNLHYSKLSGAIGNYGGLEPKVEARALEILGLEPFYGATQIMPRSLYAPLGQALCQLVLELDNIAVAIRLGARSGQPILQEPFGKKQKGSSRMPHKKNTISCEQMEGMGRMAKGYLQMIMDNIRTWEERAIEQSCVERVAWPDLFHVVLHSLKTITAVLEGLTVYPDNMLREIVDSRGCYAAGEAKDFLRRALAPLGLTTEDTYRMVQLAAFNVFEPSTRDANLRQKPFESFEEASELLSTFQQPFTVTPPSIKDVLLGAALRSCEQLDASEADVQKWNDALRQVFEYTSTKRDEFAELFTPAYLLRNEETLYRSMSFG